MREAGSAAAISSTWRPREGDRRGRLPGVSLMSRGTRIAFFSMLLVALLTGAICAVASSKWVDRPFAGALINERMAVGNIGRYSWTGIEAGLKYPDKVVAVNGHPVRSMKELDSFIRPALLGLPMTYLIERDGRQFQMMVATMRFTWMDLLLTFGLMFLAGLIYLSIGVIVFLLKPATRASWAFLLVSFFLGIYGISAFDLLATHMGFVRMHLTALAFFAAALFHLSLVFPEQWAAVERRPWLQWLPYIPSALLITPLLALYPAPSFTVFYRLIMFYLILSTLALVAASLRAFFAKRSALASQRAKVILFGVALAFPIPAMAHTASLFGGVPIQQNFIAIPLVVFPAVVAYAIAKHNLFDADVYIKRAIGYGVMTAIVGVAYLSMQTLINTVVARPVFGQQAEKIYPLLFAVLIVFLFNPVSQKVREVVDRVFFRARSDYKKTISVVSNALTSMLNVDEILKRVVNTVRTEMFVDASGVVVLEPETNTCQTFLLADHATPDRDGITSVAMGFDDPLVQLIQEQKTLITKYDLEEDPYYSGIKDVCLEGFARLDASLAIPLIYHDTVTGVLAVGHKKSGQFFAREDIDLLSTMADQAAVAIQNATEHQRVVRYAEELETSLRRIQILESIKTNLSKFVPKTVQDLIEKSPQAPLLDKRELDVSVVFADMTGYTRLSAEMDLDQLNRLVERYFGAFLDEIMKHGGDVNETAGDGLMVIFQGGDRRDHAHAAVRAALGIQQRTVEINAAMSDRREPIMMKVGVNSGLASVGATKIEGAAGTRWTYTASGPTTNIAARLAALAEGGSVVVSEETQSRVENDFKAEDLGPQSLKNVPQPVRAYRLGVSAREAGEPIAFSGGAP
jgi:class 3 adenylate cyclase